jgi:hypothetical protein
VDARLAHDLELSGLGRFGRCHGSLLGRLVQWAALFALVIAAVGRIAPRAAL